MFKKTGKGEVSGQPVTVKEKKEADKKARKEKKK